MRGRGAVARRREHRSGCQVFVARSLVGNRIAISRIRPDRSTWYGRTPPGSMSAHTESFGGLTDGSCGIAEPPIEHNLLDNKELQDQCRILPARSSGRTPRNLEPHYSKPACDRVRIDLDSELTEFYRRRSSGPRESPGPVGRCASSRNNQLSSGVPQAWSPPWGQIRARFLGTPPTSRSRSNSGIRSRHRDRGPDPSKVPLRMIYQRVLETPFDPGVAIIPRSRHSFNQCFCECTMFRAAMRIGRISRDLPAVTRREAVRGGSSRDSSRRCATDPLRVLARAAAGAARSSSSRWYR